ncbi:MAG: prepilin-type N-terminal cleavage/methylation domain-containing protein [Candidatus Sumerlaeota bacterium]|nr:prepilin-type N-terminal cleavage/methylation domain-containing protein [Candidatus Sumerlaeota bacterium]
MSFEREGLHVTRARNNMKIMGLKKALRGFSIIELLIAIIIIGILVAIIIPRLATRSEQARIRAAESDLEEIRKAEEHAGIDTGYYYRLYVLDDNRGGDGYGWGDSRDVNDGILDEAGGLFNPAYGNNQTKQNIQYIFINVNDGQLCATANVIYNKLLDNETAFGWNGRYITWHKDFNKNDIPDDPWNHDYLFFTPAGLVLEPDGVVIPTCSVDATNGNIIAGGTYNCIRFDRFVVLSLGPNGLPGDGGTDINAFGTGDDIIQKW